MGGLSPIHILIFAVIAILLLGGGRFSNLMGDVAKGVKNFKKGMSEEDAESRASPRIEGKSGAQQGAQPAFDRDGNQVRDERP